MDLLEVSEFLAMVNDMENLTEVEVVLGETTIKASKGSTEKSKPALTITEENGFKLASAVSAPPAGFDSNLASPAQRKYATDMANTLGTGDLSNIVNGLAHALQVTTSEILHPTEWATSLTKEQANLYLDVLEEQTGRNKKGGGF